VAVKGNVDHLLSLTELGKNKEMTQQHGATPKNTAYDETAINYNLF